MHIDYKATIWFRIPIEKKEVLHQCIAILQNGGTINDLYDDIDENDIGQCETLYDSEEHLSIQQNNNNATIEAFINKYDTVPIWDNNDTSEGPYLMAYKLYLQEHNLDDDSHTVTEIQAKNYLLEEMEQDDIDELVNRVGITANTI